MSEELKLTVEGLDCAGCAFDVETILLRTDGIVNAKVNFLEETVTVEYDPEEASEEGILSAIRKMGLRVTERPKDDRIKTGSRNSRLGGL